MSNIFELDRRGYIKKRESFDLEFKQSFHTSDISKYLKTLVGMANNKGGSIVFGIKDKPHLPIGLSTPKFRETDPAVIDRQIREYFSQELHWKTEVIEFQGNEYGILSVEEAENKPVICKKYKDGVLREAAIYYRYRAESKEIEYPELKNLMDREREKEKLTWMQLIQKISDVGPQNVNIFDTYKGEISVGNGKILLDKSIIDKLKFIREGKFTEADGEGMPTLKLVGNIEGLVEPESSIPTDKLYPLFTKDLKDRLELNNYEVMCILWKLNVKGNMKYHAEVKTGKNSNSVQKYTESLIPLLKRMLNRDDFLKTCVDEYKVKIKNAKK